MSSYGARGRNKPWGPHDWQGFYFFWKCVFVAICLATVANLWYAMTYPSVCERWANYQALERVDGKDTLVQKRACTKWKEYK